MDIGSYPKTGMDRSTPMTPSEAIEIARLKAEQINCPWSSETAVATRWGILPGRRYWRVVSRIPSEGATITMNVYEWTREAHPVRVVPRAAGAP